MAAPAQVIEELTALPDDAIAGRIRAARDALGERLVILAHHYQRNEVYRHADFTGDSLKLSRQAAGTQAEFIVFCGVHFMAEVADILTRPDQIVMLPDLAAGCSMADMANLANVTRAWRELGEVIDVEAEVTPATYINSAADLKAFCGSHGGIVCTSTNARKVLDWSFAQRPRVLFFPDQHLGRNTGYRMGIPLEQMVVWDFMKPMGGLTPEQIRNARMILWKGHCSVHQMFYPAQIDEFLAKYPDAQVISHPEASFEVCEKSHFVGSTEYIIDTVTNAAPGTRWLVGTELNLVNRLHEQCKADNKSVHFMATTISMCSTMFRINPPQLLRALENLVAGKVVNQVRVAAHEAQPARLAIERMFAVS
jgi:quinolinate synthase